MTNPKPLGIGWRKCPAVTTGGKPFFWFRRSTNGFRQWYGWNRVRESWEYEEMTSEGKLAVFKPEGGEDNE